jgi:steroid delta-isomerase-like uncharacterized protein
MSTTEAENRELLVRFYEEVFNEGNLDVFDELVAEDFANHNPIRPSVIIGADEFREGVRMARSAFPDLDITIDDAIADGDKVVLRVTERGTHEETFMNIEPTGETVEVAGIHIYRVEDRQLAERWVQTDIVGLFQQLGVVELPGQ